VRASTTLLNGSEERIDEGTTSHAEQVVRKLREADRLLGEGFELPDVLRELEVSEATYHRWRAQYGGMKADVVKRLEEFEAENAKLKRIAADQMLDIEGLKEQTRTSRASAAACAMSCSPSSCSPARPRRVC